MTWYIMNSKMYLEKPDSKGLVSFTSDINRAWGFPTREEARKYSVGNEPIVEIIR